MLKSNEIIGIFDLDNTTVSKKSRDFINTAQKENRLSYGSYELPKSFVVCDNNEVYLSMLSTTTLEKRIKKGYVE